MRKINPKYTKRDLRRVNVEELGLSESLTLRLRAAAITTAHQLCEAHETLATINATPDELRLIRRLVGN